MCEEGIRDASGWEVLCAAQRFQHRAQVSMDQSLEGLGISFAQYRILELLTDARDISLSELGRRMRVTRQATRMTTGKLAAAGLVDLEREADAVYVILSDLGRKRLRLFRTATGRVLTAFEGEFAHARRSTIVMLLGKAELALETPEGRPWWLNE
jgi:DNA-binding MarR family transcriptional regulator